MRTLFSKLRFIQKELARKEVGILPSYISYYIFLSFIPLLALIIVVLSLVNKNNTSFLLFLNEVFPPNVYSFIMEFVAYYNRNIQLYTINNVVLLYLASRIYYSIFHSNTIIIKLKCCRHFIFDKLIALLNTIIILITIMILAAGIILGDYLAIFLIKYVMFPYNLVKVFRWLIAIFAIILFNLIIMLSLPHYKFSLKNTWVGAIVSGGLMFFLSIGFNFYIDNFTNFTNIYYTFSTVLIFIIWIYFISFAIVIGLIVNYLRNKDKL